MLEPDEFFLTLYIKSSGFYVSMAKSSIEVSEADNIVSIPIVYGKGLNPNDTFNLSEFFLVSSKCLYNVTTFIMAI